jgi:uncharacterized protein YecE (DUF72 family)
MYDAGTRPDGYLRAYAREFSSVEVDSTWYGTPPPERVRGWQAAVPAGFTFAFKLPREITHERRLLGCEALLDEFVASALVLGPQLEGALVQMPPDFGPAEIDALLPFLARLPAPIRWSLELRDPDWFRGETLERVREALGARGIALAVSDGAFVALETMLEQLARPTAPHAYIRWLGVRDAVSRFDRAIFDRTANLRAWAHGVRTATPMLERACAYANNHYNGHSPAVVRAFFKELGIPHVVPPRIEQTSLF